MKDAPFHVERADWQRDLGALRAVREVVFVEEQKVPLELEWDDLDEYSNHVLARDLAGNAIGTARLTPERKIGRMAVLREWRGRGVGSALLLAMLDRAREHGWPEIELHAQVDAIPFYVRHGFEAFGDEFEEAGIRHRHMRIALQPHAPPPAVRGTPAPRPESQALDFSTREEASAALLRIIADARHAMMFQTHDLDPDLLDDERVLDALRRVATSGHGASLRFLLHDAAEVLRNGHRLVALAQRLPSRIELRVPVEDDILAYPCAFVLNDVGGYLLRPLAARPGGRGDTCAPREHARLRAWFEDAWQRADPASMLRQLDL